MVCPSYERAGVTNEFAGAGNFAGFEFEMRPNSSGGDFSNEGDLPGVSHEQNALDFRFD